MFEKENTQTGKKIQFPWMNIYVILSLVFIAFTLYTNVKVKYGQYMYNNGIAQGQIQGDQRTITATIEKAGVCQPFSVELGDKRVYLINMECLQQNGGDKQAAEETN